MKKIVIFDLDGTLVRGQSQRLFMEYLVGMGLVGLAPRVKLYRWFLLSKIGLINDPELIMRYAFSFFRNWKVDVMEILVRDFLHDKLRRSFYRQGRELIAGHDPATCDLVLLSNAFDMIATTAAEHLGIPAAFGTSLENAEGRFTGNMTGRPLFGSGKERLIRDYAEQRNLTFEDSWAYGDSISDLPVLELVTHPVAVNPDRKLCREARLRNWRIIHLEE